MEQEHKPIKSKYQNLQQTIPQNTKLEWISEQRKIQSKIVYQDEHDWTVDDIELICGVDLSANKEQPNLACAGLVVYNVRQNRIEYEDYEIVKISQPYVPGFLAFREVPPLMVLFDRLKQNKPQLWPQLVILDGNGILHTNQCGLACHLGVLINVPTLGVGKTLFYIDGLDKAQVKRICDQNIKNENDFALLKGKSGQVWGAGLRNGKSATNPVYVSIGTKISLDTAIKCVILSSIHRVPEPVRLADKKSREIIESVDLKADNSGFKRYEMIFLK